MSTIFTYFYSICFLQDEDVAVGGDDDADDALDGTKPVSKNPAPRKRVNTCTSSRRSRADSTSNDSGRKRSVPLVSYSTTAEENYTLNITLKLR